MRSLTYVELDLPYCSLTFGVAPCTATGDVKCFNTLKTCQDRLHFTPEDRTLRFSVDTLDLPQETHSIPCIESMSFTPGTVSLGKDLGTRSSLSVTFRDFKFSDVGVAGDKYWQERGYDPYAQGTFWGRFRARQPYLRGKRIRYIMGTSDQELADMETRHLIVESFTGPDAQGRYTIVAKDVLKLADSDRSQAPRVSSGALIADIAAGVTSAQLSPSGIGNAEYPGSGYVAIGGREICFFTRSGDALTLGRAQYNTENQAHSAGDRVQLVLVYGAQTPATIIQHLLVNYAESFDPAWIPIADWVLETETHLRRLYSAVIPEPTGVGKLLSELVEQAALGMWWDDLSALLRLQVLRPLPLNEVIDSTSYMDASVTIADQPETRVSEVWTYYGMINPLRSVTDADNYRSVRADVNLQSISDHGTTMIRKIMSRWIPAFGQQVATRVNQLTLSRYSDPPRKFTLSLFREYRNIPRLGDAVGLQAWPLQLADGTLDQVPTQITRINPTVSTFDLTMEEARFVTIDVGDLSDRVITVDGNIPNFNLREIHDNIYPPPEASDPPTVTLVLNPGVMISSTRAGQPAFNVGNWPSFMIGRVYLDIRGIIQGPGGRGGDGAAYPGIGFPGEMGGTGMLIRFPVHLDMSGSIRGGGGGGGGAGGEDYFLGSQVRGGGGGGGTGGAPGGAPGWPAEAGAPGGPFVGGIGGREGFINNGQGSVGSARAGHGGNPGAAGNPAEGPFSSPGGNPGFSVDGFSFIFPGGTITGSFLGPTTN